MRPRGVAEATRPGKPAARSAPDALRARNNRTGSLGTPARVEIRHPGWLVGELSPLRAGGRSPWRRRRLTRYKFRHVAARRGRTAVAVRGLPWATRYESAVPPSGRTRVGSSLYMKRAAHTESS